MKRCIAASLVVAFLVFVGAPQHVQAADSGSTADGALIGAGIGLVIGLIVYVISVSSEKSMDENKPATHPKSSDLRFHEGTTGPASLWTWTLSEQPMVPQASLARGPQLGIGIAF